MGGTKIDVYFYQINVICMGNLLAVRYILISVTAPVR